MDPKFVRFLKRNYPWMILVALLIYMALVRSNGVNRHFPVDNTVPINVSLNNRTDPFRFENDVSLSPRKEYVAEEVPVTEKPLSESGQTAGERRKLTLDGMDLFFRWCPPGEFPMGYDLYNKPHRVRLTRGFWILETEVTQKMWETVMKSNPSCFSARGQGAELVKNIRTDDFPVENIIWYEAVEFCKKLTLLAGFEKTPFVLPTEAQWEYACRAGTLHNFGPSGLVDERMWFASNSDERTHRVRTKQPNEWGLYDMQGNVMEMCSDLVVDTPQNQPSYDELQRMVYPEVTIDPVGATFGEYRHARGGSWQMAPRYGQPGRHVFLHPKKESHHTGFRIVLIPDITANKKP